MYVLQLPARSRYEDQEEIFFELTNANDAINLFVAKTKRDRFDVDGNTTSLDVSLQTDKGGHVSRTFVQLETNKFDVAQSEVG